MKISITKLFLVLFLSILFFSFNTKPTNADPLEELNKKIEEYTNQINKLQSEASTLSNQIAEFDARINLTLTKIAQTQEQIKQLGGRIDQLELSLGSLTEAFNSRAEETYKMARVDNNPIIMISSDNIDDAVSKYFYLQKIQEADNQLIGRLETAKTTYNNQKTDLENLEKVLGEQKLELDAQKSAKANLLAVTRNDEKKYQELLAKAQAEAAAIQAIIAGKGKETEVGEKNAGDKIASIIDAPSPCSSGGHLHFEVYDGTSLQDPNNYLAPTSYSYSYPASSYSYYGQINPHGSWGWPMNEPILINQGYGSHSYARSFYRGGMHTGIDMESQSGDLTVKAVAMGTLYRGSIACGGGTLRYVKMDHKDSNINTFYLHVNY